MLASSIQNWGEGELGEGGPGEWGEPDVPWWFGLSWGWWRRVCDPVTFLSLQSVCFIIFWGGRGGGEFGWKIKDLEASKGAFLWLQPRTAPWLFQSGFGRALRAQC